MFSLVSFPSISLLFKFDTIFLKFSDMDKKFLFLLSILIFKSISRHFSSFKNKGAQLNSKKIFKVYINSSNLIEFLDNLYFSKNGFKRLLSALKMFIKY